MAKLSAASARVWIVLLVAGPIEGAASVGLTFLFPSSTYVDVALWAPILIVLGAIWGIATGGLAAAALALARVCHLTLPVQLVSVAMASFASGLVAYALLNGGVGPTNLGSGLVIGGIAALELTMTAALAIGWAYRAEAATALSDQSASAPERIRDLL